MRKMALLCGVALVAAGCGGGGPSTSGGGKLSDDKVVFGVLNDQSGVYAQLSGKNSIKAVELAIADYKTKYGDKAVVKDHRRGDRPTTRTSPTSPTPRRPSSTTARRSTRSSTCRRRRPR